MKLFVNKPVISGDTITASYLFNGTEYSHVFIAPLQLDNTDPIILKLVNWITVIHALYLFSIDYFTKIETNFYLSKSECEFFEKLIFNGMAEFRVENKIPVQAKTTITSLEEDEDKNSITKKIKSRNGRLLLNGGGKDGIVSTILLGEADLDFDFFQVGTSKAQAIVTNYFSKTPLIFRRQMDERRNNAKFSGHRPTSAAIALTAVLSAYISGKQDVIASNEASSNEANLNIDGIDINHQYSKSFEFEQDLSKLLKDHEIPIRYFSILRPIHELQIAKILTAHPEYADKFISCNHGFRKGFWCMKCSKCAFITLILNALSPEFASKTLGLNSINTQNLKKHLSSLIDHAVDKPFECVGTLEECKVAAKLVLQNKDVGLDNDLSKIFSEHTSKINQKQIEEVLSGFNHENSLPVPEYNEVITILQNIKEL